MGAIQIRAAIDLGAGSGRVVAGLFDGESLSLEETHRFPTPLYLDGRCWRWDIATIEAEVRTGLEALSRKGELVSVGIDSWGVDFVLSGEDGNPIEMPRSYRNEQTRDIVPGILRLLGEENLYARTGIQTQHFNTLFQLAWLAAHEPKLLEKSRRFSMVPDWLAYRLGAPLVNELSNASTTELLDAFSHDWDGASLSALGVDRGLFSTPLGPGTRLCDDIRIGSATASYILPASHDTGSAVAGIPYGNGFDRERAAFICTGTWCLIGQELRAPDTSEAARRANFTNEVGAGGMIRFLKNCMGLWILQGLKSSWGEDLAFDAMLAAAARLAPLSAPLFDAEDRRFFSPESMRCAMDSWWHDAGLGAPPDIGGYARSAVDSLVLSMRNTLMELEVIRGKRLEAIYLVGGGARNTLLCQGMSDATGLPLFAGPVEASVIGNLAIQAGDRSIPSRCFTPTSYIPRGPMSAWESAAEKLRNMTITVRERS